MERKLGKDSDEFKMFEEYWALLQKFYVPETTDEYWKAAVSEIGSFAKKYSTKYATDLGTALLNELERKYNRVLGGRNV